MGSPRKERRDIKTQDHLTNFGITGCFTYVHYHDSDSVTLGPSYKVTDNCTSRRSSNSSETTFPVSLSTISSRPLIPNHIQENCKTSRNIL